MNEKSRQELSQQFKNFALNECRGSSNLYEHLAQQIAKDDQLLALASQAKDDQPVPNLLLAAVQYLLLKGNEHPLGEYYPSITEHPKEVEDSFFHFRDFCRRHREYIIYILKNKRVQTNEVRRCAYLYPSFCFIYEQIKKPISLIEIGTTAGLQLLWDKYSYSYGSSEKYGDVKSEVHITSEIKGDHIPLLFPESPPVKYRFGVDIHVNDLKDREDYLWLRSLIWPEHKERIKRFNRAASCVKDHSLDLIEGNGVEILPKIAAKIPESQPICVFHTHVANQIPEKDKHKLFQYINELGQRQDVFHLYNNMWDLDLHLDYFIDGKEYNETLAETDGHARWFRWKI